METLARNGDLRARRQSNSDGALRSNWTREELNRIIGSAHTMAGHVSGIPAADWWPAFLFVLIDTRAAPVHILLASPEDFDEATGRLRVGAFIHRLHPVAYRAVQRVRQHAASLATHPARLLPWPLDASALGPPVRRPDRPQGERRRPCYMLLRYFKVLLFRANLPHGSDCLFERLKGASIDGLDPAAPFTPRPGAPTFPRWRPTFPRVWPEPVEVLPFPEAPWQEGRRALTEFIRLCIRIGRLQKGAAQ